MSGAWKSRFLAERPVWITGVGAVSSAGSSADALWQAAAGGELNRSWQDFGGGHRYLTSPVSGDDDLPPGMQTFRKLDRSARFAACAAREALSQAGIDAGHPHTGVVFGTSRGPFFSYLEAVNSLAGQRMSPRLAATSTMASISGSIAHHWKLSGPAWTLSAACASAAHAIIAGAEKILLGDAEVMIVGGTEACLHPAVLGYLSAASVLGSHEDDALACRPFDVERNGLLPGEGAGCLVLEAAAAASRRGARPLAVLRGWSAASHDGGRTGISPDSPTLFESMARAIRVAGIPVSDVGYLHAHGTGTRLNDLAEAEAVWRLQQERETPIPVTSTKPVTGHCLGATPALEAIVAISALHHGLLPPTQGCLAVDPDCRIDVVRGGARPVAVDCAVLNSSGFWGHLATLVVRKPG